MILRMKLPHGETDPRKRYSMPDPDALFDTFFAARRVVYPGTGELRTPPYADVTISYEQVCALLALGEGYIDLTMYELGQEHCVGKLRDIWRARRSRAEQEGG